VTIQNSIFSVLVSVIQEWNGFVRINIWYHGTTSLSKWIATMIRRW